MSMTLNNASSSYRGMSANSGDFKTKSKTLIDNPDKKEPEDNNNGGVISSSSNTVTNS